MFNLVDNFILFIIFVEHLIDRLLNATTNFLCIILLIEFVLEEQYFYLVLVVDRFIDQQ